MIVRLCFNLNIAWKDIYVYCFLQLQYFSTFAIVLLLIINSNVYILLLILCLFLFTPFPIFSQFTIKILTPPPEEKYKLRPPTPADVSDVRKWSPAYLQLQVATDSALQSYYLLNHFSLQIVVQSINPRAGNSLGRLI